MGEIEFDLDETNESVDETFKRWDSEFRKNHPIKQKINDLFHGSIFGYAPWYSLSHPHVLFMDLMRSIKWTYQRVYRGWDDRASWSIDWWLDDIMPNILLQLKKNSHGTPIEFYDGLPHDENYNYGDIGDKIARERWNSELDKMIFAFMSHKEILENEYETEEERKALEEIFKIGIESFIKHYDELWD